MVRARAVILALALAAGLTGCGGGGDDAGEATVAALVEPQLAYLDPASSAVIAVDLRWRGGNWDDIRPFASRVLRAFRERASGEEALAIPPNAEGAAAQAASFVGLDFRKDVEPVLDGHLVVGVVEPPREPLAPDVAALAERLDGAELDADGVPRRDGRRIRGPAGRPLTADDARRVFEARDRRDQAAEPTTVAVYRTQEGDLLRVAERVTDGEELRPRSGYDDVRLFDSETALVGRDTLVFADGADADDAEAAGERRPGAVLKTVLDRADAGDGFPLDRLGAAERDAGIRDPFVVATGDLTLASGEFVEEPGLQRARRDVPYLRALRRAGAALDITGDGIDVAARVVTDGARLQQRDLPLAPAGEVALPEAPDAIAGGSRDQSFTTTFLSRVARRLFADSRFARAVARAERDLGSSFEDEVLRQFSCPSVSVLEPRPASEQPGVQRFGARSCVRDPERMRRLLPQLREHLPAILTGLQGLGDEGLVGLLLLAPDAPLTPGGLLAQIEVRPSGGRARDETLYEITGLREDADTELAQAGPDRIVFGLVGDVFVVASDAEMARRAAELETRPVEGEAASALRAPFGRLLARERDDDVAQAFAAVLGDAVVRFRADPAATVAEGRLAFAE